MTVLWRVDPDPADTTLGAEIAIVVETVRSPNSATPGAAALAAHGVSPV
ncbi:MAG: hypothetical protein WAW17_18740 [Rhodococcus sp. (in: high G+C Gram-positive bacteria)]